MPLPGGPSDKYGNRYEDLWTASCLLDLMEESADEMRLEPPGEEGAGVEFWVSRAGQREYHQVKRQNGSEGRWTLSNLNGNSVLANFWDKLQDPSATCALVSKDSVQYLTEFAERVQGARSWEEYELEFVRAEPQKEALAALRAYWNGCSVADAYTALRRIRIVTISEERLRRDVEERIEHLVVGGQPPDVLAMLIQFARESIHQTLVPADVWRAVERNPAYRRRRIEQDLRLLATIDATTAAFMAPLRKTLIAGEMLTREQSGQIVQRIQSSDQPQTVLLTGEAGFGKSHVALHVADTLQAAGWLVLAFGSDVFVGARRPEEVGERLFSRRLSPAEVLARAAHERHCILILDQIDQLSRTTSQNSTAYECFEALLEEATAFSHMRVLLTCRAFDLEQDERLKRLVQHTKSLEVIQLERLQPETVREVVAQMGINGVSLTKKQLELLAIPLHLYLLETIVEDDARDGSRQSLSFATVEDLFDGYWTHKQQRIHERHISRQVAWAEVIDTLVNDMNDHQRLSVPVALLDRFGADAEAMTSEHVLVQQGKRYTFFHEEFFDYAFARRFTAEERQIVPFLGSDSQDLFRRAQVRHILSYQRHLGEDDQATYLTTLRDILTRSEIRFHLKQAALEILRSVDDPRPDEWSILESLVEGEDETLATATVRTLDGSVPWFELLDRLGVIQRWLIDDRFVWQALRVLTGVQRLLPDLVAELVEPYAEDPRWRERYAWLMNFCDVDASPRFFEFFLHLIDAGALDEARAVLAANGDFWLLVYDLPSRHAVWACAVIGHYLNRRLVLSKAKGHPNPFNRDNGSIQTTVSSEGYLLRAAQRAPSAFAEQVLPFMLDVLDLTARRTGEPPWKDSVWEHRYVGTVHGIDHEVLDAMARALQALAADAPAEFRAIAASRLRESSYETAQYLLMRGYAGNGTEFADEAVEYLCDNSARLALSYFGDSHGAAGELIEAATPHCSADYLARLEQILLTYYPLAERGARGRQQLGRAQLILLEGITPDRRSPAVTRRLGELRRKFGDHATDEARPTFHVGWAQSPIPEAAAEKMSDAHWLRAIMRYDDDALRIGRAEGIVGGADQLAQVLQSQAKQSPVRFAQLLSAFPDSVQPVYFDAVLRGLTETEGRLDGDLLVSVATRCHQLPGRPCGKDLSWLIAKYADQSLATGLLEIVGWYATEDPSPDREQWRTPAYGGGVYYNGNVFNAGVNSVRGSAALVLAELITADGRRVGAFDIAFDHLVSDALISVRSCAAVTALAVYRHDQERGIALFLRLCESEDVLLAAPPIRDFLCMAVRSHFPLLLPLIRRMFTSALPEVAAAGAGVACLAALIAEDAGPLIEECLAGNEAQRRGAAWVFAINLGNVSCRGTCEAALSRLMNDSEALVREEAAKCFNEIRAEDVTEYKAFIGAFVQSAAFVTHPFALVHLVTEANAVPADIACLVCERFVEVAREEIGNISTHASAYTHRIAGHLAETYRKVSNPEIRSRCLTILERMQQAGAWDLDQTLEGLER